MIRRIQGLTVLPLLAAAFVLPLLGFSRRAPLAADCGTCGNPAEIAAGEIFLYGNFTTMEQASRAALYFQEFIFDAYFEWLTGDYTCPEICPGGAAGCKKYWDYVPGQVPTFHVGVIPTGGGHGRSTSNASRRAA
jgi:hypothetical protein